jgi:hypothetical protein
MSEVVAVEIKNPLKKTNSPKIISFNITEQDKNILESSRYTIDHCSLGYKVKLPKSSHDGNYCLPNHNFPANLHEYNVYIIDLCNNITKDYKADENLQDLVTGEEENYIYCPYPQNVFNSIPLSADILKNTFEEISMKPAIILIFSNFVDIVSYKHLKIIQNRRNIVNEYKFTNYSFSPFNVPILKDKSGTILKLFDKSNSTILGDILNKYLNEAQYNIVFKQMTKWTQDDGNVNDDHFVPLIFNDVEEIISFFYLYKKQRYIFLPDIKKKGDLIIDFLNEYFPTLTPELFPDNSINGWQNEERYFLPNHETLLNQKEQLDNEYNDKIKAVNNKIEENKEKYKYLNTLLTGTGEELVLAVMKYLSYLGFEKIINVDLVHPDNKEEDIQIQLDDRLIIIEVKGIGGTSTDSDCMQISKIRFRRCQERNDFNIDAIYLVNHQRHLPPHERKAVPFSDNQIKDAKSDKRSLLTTLDLYKIFPLVENNVIPKEIVRKSLFEKGLINLSEDSLLELGIVKEAFKDNHVIILNLENTYVSKGDILVSDFSNQYQVLTIENIQMDNKDVDSTSNGEVGIKVDKYVHKNAKIYKRRI